MNTPKHTLWLHLLACFVSVVHGKLVFTELMIQTLSAADPLTMWFELYNAEATTIPLNGSEILLCSNIGSLNPFLPCSSRILVTTRSVGPFGYLLVGNNADPASNGGVPVDIQLLPFPAFSKDGSGRNELRFYSTAGDLKPEDFMAWTTTAPANSTNYTFVPGASLARISVFASGRDPLNWQPSTSFIDCANGGDKGTPGRINTYSCHNKAPIAPGVPTKSPAKADSPALVSPPVKAPASVPTLNTVPVPTLNAAPVPTLNAAPTVNTAPVPTFNAAPAAAPTVTKRCGLFRLGIICLNGCGLAGRALGICKS
jgi:hypothetical protein